MIGMPPGETKRLSFWEYFAVLDFWNEAHVTDQISETDKDEIWMWMESMPPVPVTGRKLNGH